MFFNLVHLYHLCVILLVVVIFLWYHFFVGDVVDDIKDESKVDDDEELEGDEADGCVGESNGEVGNAGEFT